MEDLAGSGSNAQRRAGTDRSRVVVGVDESDGSRAALRYALHAAAARNADLEVVSTFPTDLYWADVTLLDATWLSQKRESTRERTRAFVDQVRSAPEFASFSATPVHVTIGAGAAADELLRQAVDAELLVVGSRGHGAVRSTLLGSVALHCATHARCPVVVVHPPLRPDQGDRPRRIVVGIDGSNPSRAALDCALQEAARIDAEISAVVAYDVADYWTAGMNEVVASGPEQLLEQVLRHAKSEVDGILRSWQASSSAAVPTVTVLAHPGTPTSVLLEEASGADLLVVGYGGRGEIRGMLLGSVALRTLIHATCPVMVVPVGVADRFTSRTAQEPVAAG